MAAVVGHLHRAVWHPLTAEILDDGVLRNVGALRSARSGDERTRRHGVEILGPAEGVGTKCCEDAVKTYTTTLRAAATPGAPSPGRRPAQEAAPPTANQYASKRGSTEWKAASAGGQHPLSANNAERTRRACTLRGESTWPQVDRSRSRTPSPTHTCRTSGHCRPASPQSSANSSQQWSKVASTRPNLERKRQLRGPSLAPTWGELGRNWRVLRQHWPHVDPSEAASTELRRGWQKRTCAQRTCAGIAPKRWWTNRTYEPGS